MVPPVAVRSLLKYADLSIISYAFMRTEMIARDFRLPEDHNAVSGCIRRSDLCWTTAGGS